MERTIVDEIVEELEVSCRLAGMYWALKHMDEIRGMLGSLNQKQSQDIMGFIQYCKEKKVGNGEIAVNILHDIDGIFSNASCFLPRTDGYAKYLKK